MYRRYAGLFSFKSDNARNKKAQNAPSDQPAGQFAEPLRQGAYFQQGVVTGEIQQVVITNVHAGFAGFGDQLQQTAELPVEDGIACRGPPPRSTDASISAADRRRDTMKTTLDGVVFLLPHVSGHAKNGVSPQADFPRTERRARNRHAPFGRVGRAAEKEGIAIFFEKKLKTILSENHMSPHPGGKAASSQRTDPGRRPHKQKTGETHNVPPVLAPGFQPPEAAGQRKSARRSGPASAKGQRTGSQYAVRTPGRVQYYPHGRR